MAFLTRSDAPADPWWAGVAPTDHRGSTPASVGAVAPHDGLWAPLYTDLTEAQVEEAHRFGLGVVPWTVNRPHDMRRMIAWKVDGIISDYPDVLAAITREMPSG
jgi:glycerophosphoryl diester phosphodiesterase